MVGNKAYVVVESYADGSGIVAVWGPFGDEESANGWPGLPVSNNDTKFETMPMHEAPEWFVGYEPEEDE